MNETTQQYMSRITGYVAGKDHFAVLRATPKTVGRLLRGKPARALSRKPDPDKWSVAEILAHIAESELVISYRLRMVLGSNGTTIQAFDQNAWQSNASALIKDPKRAAALFRTLRESNVALLRSIPKEQWDYFGMHQERGKETVARIVEMTAGHDVNHLRQIEEILRTKRVK